MHGQINVTNTPVQISTEQLRTGITIKSPITNTSDIFVGNSIGVSTTTGYILSPGETIFLEIASAGLLFVRTGTNTATLVYIGS